MHSLPPRLLDGRHDAGDRARARTSGGPCRPLVSCYVVRMTDARATPVSGPGPDGGVATHREGSWTFLTNHARVLMTLADGPDLRLRDVATMIGITERGVQRIVAESEKAGYLRHQRVGRRNTYQVRPDAPLRHPLGRNIEIRELLRLLDGRDSR